MYWTVIATSLVGLVIFIRHFMSSPPNTSSQSSSYSWNYNQMKCLIHSSNIRLPAMFVDEDVFDRNARHLMDIVCKSGKSLRIATKSIRSLELIQRLRTLSDGVLKSYMCYSVEEAHMLSQQGLDDFYIPYPTVQLCDIHLALDMSCKGKTIALTVDSVAHVETLDKLCKEYFTDTRNTSKGIKLRVAADLDLSLKLLGGLIHLGAHRSQMDSVEKFAAVERACSRSEYVRLAGAMGYEAHVAGLPDENPHDPLPNVLVRFVKKFFFRSTLRFRKDIADYCKTKGIVLEFFNGGGSGNIRDACADPSITEVTAGSAFLQSQLFDYFANNECDPALCFALQATRVNQDHVCCQSGGFVASGSCSQDKFPRPFANPLQLSHYGDEGYGEVQTPLQIKGRTGIEGAIGLGDPVLFRPAKAGEIGEHFLKYHLKKGYKIIGEVKTYRGQGHVFY